MSSPQAPINLTLNTSANIPTGQLDSADVAWIELINHSPFLCQLTMPGTTLIIPAWYDYPIQMQSPQGVPFGNYSFPMVLTPVLQTIPGSGFTSSLTTIIFGKGEQPASTIPQPLGGGPINLAVATSVVNQGTPPGTSVVFAEPAGDAAPNGATNITNNGQETLGDATYNGLLTVQGPGNVNSAQSPSQQIYTDAAGKTSLQLIASSPPFLQLTADATPNDNTQWNLNQLSFNDAANTQTVQLAGTNPPTLTLKDDAGDSIVFGVSATKVNGSAGSYTAVYPFWGSGGKIAIVTFGGYTNGSTSVITLPSSFSRGIYFAFGIGAATVTNSAGNFILITVLATVAAAGTEAADATLHSAGFGNINASITTITISAVAVAINGTIVLIGN